MPFPTIPGVQHVSKSIVRDARNRPNNRQAEQPTKPDIARGSAPNRDRAVDPSIEPILGINGMQTPPHVVHSDAEGRERIRIEINVAKVDCARPGRANKPIMLPVNASVTHRAFGVVPDREFLGHHAFIFKT
jgi:hypothetical protein